MNDEQMLTVLIGKLDSDHRGEREAALQKLYEFLQDRKLSFRAFSEALTSTVPRPLYDETEARLKEFIAANEQLSRHATAAERDNQQLRRKLGIKEKRAMTLKAVGDAVLERLPSLQKTASRVASSGVVTMFKGIPKWAKVIAVLDVIMPIAFAVDFLEPSKVDAFVASVPWDEKSELHSTITQWRPLALGRLKVVASEVGVRDHIETTRDEHGFATTIYCRDVFIRDPKTLKNGTYVAQPEPFSNYDKDEGRSFCTLDKPQVKSGAAPVL